VQYTNMILSIAKMVKVPGALLLAICMQETGLNNTYHTNDGNSTSFGVCQIKFQTARNIGYKGSAMGLMVPSTNARWAAEYLKYQIDRYDGDWCMAVAAYNAGSFNNSKVMPGYPRNLKYVRGVQRKLASNLRSMISCGQKIAED
jgi:soluble lytic murein transglycosylase-like protein